MPSVPAEESNEEAAVHVAVSESVHETESTDLVGEPERGERPRLIGRELSETREATRVGLRALGLDVVFPRRAQQLVRPAAPHAAVQKRSHRPRRFTSCLSWQQFAAVPPAVIPRAVYIYKRSRHPTAGCAPTHSRYGLERTQPKVDQADEPSDHQPHRFSERRATERRHARQELRRDDSDE
jgi:hypothetical protein